MGNNGDSDESNLNRRHMLTAFGTTAAASGLAGCRGGGGDGGDGGGGQELGERVPKVVLEYFPGGGGLNQILETMSPTIKENLEELGVAGEVKLVETLTQVRNAFGDKRTHHIAFWSYVASPERLDLHYMLRRYDAA